MKLKKSSDQEMSAESSSGPVIADRFKLDVGAPEAKSGGGIGTTIAVVCSLLCIGLLGFTAWLIYQHFTLIENI